MRLNQRLGWEFKVEEHIQLWQPDCRRPDILDILQKLKNKDQVQSHGCKNKSMHGALSKESEALVVNPS
jgi:hypothetical protein